jgi:hypothetical protein
MIEINGLKVNKAKSGWLVTDGSREFAISEKLEVAADWWCGYETIKLILEALATQTKVKEED